jgi:hypothetical protein
VKQKNLEGEFGMEIKEVEGKRILCSECRYWLDHAFNDGSWGASKKDEVESSLCSFEPKVVVTPIKETIEYVKCVDRNLKNDCLAFKNVWEYRRRKKMEKEAIDVMKKSIFVTRWKQRFRKLLFWRRK